MTETPNLHLTKDARNDHYSVDRVNANSDRIDGFAGETAASLSDLDERVEALEEGGVPADAYTKAETDTLLAAKADQSDLSALAATVAGKQDEISDLAAIRSGAASGATAVQPSAMQAALADKQDTISDLAAIRSGASAGSTAVQPGELSTALNGKVDKMTGYGLSSNDYTTAEKQKLSGLSNYDDTEVRGLISEKQDTISDLAAIRSGASAGATAVQTIKINGITQTKTGSTVNLQAYPTKSSLGLGNVDNTSDLAKPISTAVQADQQRQDIVIADTVRSGRKNKFKNTASSGQMGNVRLTVNADGSILADGVAQDKKATGNIYFDIGTISSDSEIFDGNHFLCGFPSTAAGGMLYISMGSYTQRDYGSGVTLPTTSETGTATVRVYFGTGTVVNNVLIKPMICLKSAFDMSPEFQPYAPTNRELYEMILALQNGGA